MSAILKYEDIPFGTRMSGDFSIGAIPEGTELLFVYALPDSITQMIVKRELSLEWWSTSVEGGSLVPHCPMRQIVCASESKLLTIEGAAELNEIINQKHRVNIYTEKR